MVVDEKKIYTKNISVGVCLWYCRLNVGWQLGSRFFHPWSWIRIRNTELTKNSSIFNPKKCYQVLGNMIWDVYPRSRFFSSAFFYSWIQDPDPGWRKKGIRDSGQTPGIYFPELRKHFFYKNTLILCCDPNPGTGAFITLDPGCFHPGFAPLLNSIRKNSSPLSLTSNKTSAPFRPLFRSCQDGEPGHSLTDCLKNVKYIRYRKLPVLTAKHYLPDWDCWSFFCCCVPSPIDIE